jgi:DNA-binding GntR family transcriptional regulator
MEGANAALSAATGSAAQVTADNRFHEALVSTCGNERLLHLLRRQFSHARDPRDFERVGMRNLQGSICEHARIIESIKAGTFDLAADRIRHHWREGGKLVADAVGSPAA